MLCLTVVVGPVDHWQPALSPLAPRSGADLRPLRSAGHDGDRRRLRRGLVFGADGPHGRRTRQGDRRRSAAADAQHAAAAGGQAGMTERIEPHKCETNRLGIDAEVDFALVFAMLHEVPDQDRLLARFSAA